MNACLVSRNKVAILEVALAASSRASAGDAVVGAGRAGAGGNVVEKAWRANAETGVLEKIVVGLAVGALVFGLACALGAEVVAGNALG